MLMGVLVVGGLSAPAMAIVKDGPGEGPGLPPAVVIVPGQGNEPYVIERDVDEEADEDADEYGDNCCGEEEADDELEAGVDAMDLGDNEVPVSISAGARSTRPGSGPAAPRAATARSTVARVSSRPGPGPAGPPSAPVQSEHASGDGTAAAVLGTEIERPAGASLPAVAQAGSPVLAEPVRSSSSSPEEPGVLANVLMSLGAGGLAAVMGRRLRRAVVIAD